MTALYYIAGACVIWTVVASILIARDLQKRGIKVSFLWLRVLILKYLSQYQKITREENGRTGPLFYHYVIPINIALVIVIFFIIRGCLL